MHTTLITGGTGLIGSHLSRLLAKEGHTVNLLSRGASAPSEGVSKVYQWDIDKEQIDEKAIATADYIIHLAGVPVAGAKWTKKRKEQIYFSRVAGTMLLSKKINEVGKNVKAFISASAVGYYGDCGDRWLTEDAPNGNDFLAHVCRDWEKYSIGEGAPDVRSVALRTGIVLSKEGGALPELEKSMNFGIATYLGDGSQYYSWLHIDDICRMYLHALQTETMQGAYNAVAPEPVTNKELVSAIRKAKGCFALELPAPTFVLKFALGEMSDAILGSQRCTSKKIEQTGFRFSFPDLKGALRDIYAK